MVWCGVVRCVVVWCKGRRRDSSGVEGRIDVTEDYTEHGEEKRREERREKVNGQSVMSAIIR